MSNSNPSAFPFDPSYDDPPSVSKRPTTDDELLDKLLKADAAPEQSEDTTNG